MLRRLFVYIGVGSFAALTIATAGCTNHVGATAASSPAAGKAGLLPMRLDVTGEIVAAKAMNAVYHQYWRYDAIPIGCDKSDGASNTYDVRNATFTVGTRSEHFANLYFVRCQATAHTWQGGIVSAHLLPLRLEISGDLANAGRTIPFDRHLKAAATPVSCDGSDKPLPEPITAVPGEHLKNAMVVFALEGQTRAFRSLNVYLIRCSKEK